MWDSQSQRIGMMRCTPVGYWLQALARILGSIGFFLFPAIFIFLLIYKIAFGTFDSSLYWLFAIPFVFGFSAEILFLSGWYLAGKKDFDYDYETREASWTENGKQIKYRWKSKSLPRKQSVL
jgi:hypothetical protein